MKTPSRYSQIFRLILLSCLLLVTLVAWQGPIRDQDLKVYRISLPTLLEERPLSEVTGLWKVSALRAVDEVSSGHDDFLLDVDFEAVVPEGVTSERLGLTARYAITTHEARLVEVNSLSPEDGVGRFLPVISPVGENPEEFKRTVALLETRGSTYRYLSGRSLSEDGFASPQGGDDVSPTHVGLIGLAALGEKEFLTIERRVMPSEPPQQYITLLQLPSTESPESSASSSKSTVAELKGRPLVDLGRIGFTALPGGIAIFSDAKTLAIISGEEFSLGKTGSSELWLVRLPGSLRASMGLIYIASVITVLLAGILLIISLRRPKVSASAAAV